MLETELLVLTHGDSHKTVLGMGRDLPFKIKGLCGLPSHAPYFSQVSSPVPRSQTTYGRVSLRTKTYGERRAAETITYEKAKVRIRRYGERRPVKRRYVGRSTLVSG